MNCSKCGYTMEAWDTVCPRCGGKGLPEASPKTDAANASQKAATLSSAKPSTPATPLRATSTPQANEDYDEDGWLKLLGGGLIFLVLAGWEYFSLTYYETHGGVHLMRWWHALLYNFLGKWPLVLGEAAVGVLFIVLGIVAFLQRPTEQRRY